MAPNYVQDAFTRLMAAGFGLHCVDTDCVIWAFPGSQSSLNASELMVALHNLDLEKHSIDIKVGYSVLEHDPADCLLGSERGGCLQLPLPATRHLHPRAARAGAQPNCRSADTILSKHYHLVIATTQISPTFPSCFCELVCSLSPTSQASKASLILRQLTVYMLIGIAEFMVGVLDRLIMKAVCGASIETHQCVNSPPR